MKNPFHNNNALHHPKLDQRGNEIQVILNRNKVKLEPMGAGALIICSVHFGCKI